MRHSFLPQQEQKILKHGYRVHLIVVALFSLSVVGIIGIVSLFPAYIYVSLDERNQNTLLLSGKEKMDNTGITEYEKDLKTDSELLATVRGTLGNSLSSDIIEKVVRVRSSIKISSISLVSVSTTTVRVLLQGFAPTRDSLVVFKSNLEKLAPGNKVDLPLSEFTKNKDITFSLSLIHTLE